jgi:alpha-muurolene/germacrene-A/gamma-muurolene/(+)-delta-cadinol synthase
MSPSATATPSPRLATFRVPDLFSRCQFTLVLHQNCNAINDASAVWYENACTDWSDEKRRALKGLKCGVLAASVYHDSDDEHLRVLSDFLNYVFLLDDSSDELLTKDNEALEKVVANGTSSFISPHTA